MHNRHLTLVIPRVLPDVINSKNPQFPALNRLLARSNQFISTASFERLLFQLFSLPSTEELPIAAITAQVDGLNTEGFYWLRADPIELRVDLAAVYMMGNSHLPPSAIPIEAQLKQLKDLLLLDGIEFYYAHPRRWYFKLASDPKIKTCLLTEVIGKDISRFLPTGDKQAYWRKLLTEIQMLMHRAYTMTHQHGQTFEGAINGVWLWGAGHLPPSPQVNWQQIWSDDVLTTGLASLANRPIAKNVSQFEMCLNNLPEGKSLVVLNPVDSLDEFKQLELHWLAPLVAALRANKLSSLDFFPGNHKLYHITSRTIRYFWRG